jgi:DNA-binding transcriptional LysR family regulator
MASLGKVGYCVVIPASLVSSRKQPTVREALSHIPIAVQTTDGEFARRMREIAVELKVAFRPALACQSFPQAASAVRSGLFASILPKLALKDFPAKGFVCVDDKALDRLQREIVLAWNPRITRLRPGAIRLLEEMQRHFNLGPSTGA